LFANSKTRELSVALAHRQEAALESEQELKLIHDSATQAGTRGQAILKNAVGSFNHSALLQQSESGSSMGAVHDCASEADATTVDNLMMLRQLHADGELDLQQAAIKALPKCLTSTLAMQVILVVLLMGCTYD
jgi:hypothetical protein